MPSGTDSTKWKRTVGSSLRGLFSVRNAIMLAAGILAGYSISVIGESTVAVPFAGSVPGVLVGVVGLAVALGVYRRGSCCDNCGKKACGCSGECGDSCSYDA